MPPVLWSGVYNDTVVTASFHVIFHCPFAQQSTVHNTGVCASEPSEARWNQEGGRIMPVSPVSISSWFSLRWFPLVPLQWWWQFPPKCPEFNTIRRYIPEDFNLQLRLLSATSWRRMEEWRCSSPIRNVNGKWIWVEHEQFQNSDLKKDQKGWFISDIRTVINRNKFY